MFSWRNKKYVFPYFLFEEKGLHLELWYTVRFTGHLDFYYSNVS